MNRKNKYKELNELFKKMGITLDLGMEKYVLGKNNGEWIDAKINLKEFEDFYRNTADEKKCEQVFVYIDYLRMMKIYREPDVSIFRVRFSLDGGYDSLNVFVKESVETIESDIWFEKLVVEFEKWGYQKEAKTIQVKGLFDKEQAEQDVRKVIHKITKDVVETKKIFHKEMKSQVNSILSRM